jgi:hypothetical protein
MDLITRAQAKASGLTTYFNGKPCPKGHVAQRKTGSGGCVECANASTKRWHSRNQDHNASYGKAYRETRGEDLLAKKREYQRAWIAANKEEKRRRDAEYERSKREQNDAAFLAYCTARSQKRRAAKIQATPTWMDKDVISGMYKLAQVFRRTGMDVHVDHIVPLQSKIVSGLHTHDNLQLMVGTMNRSKSNRAWPDMPEGSQ